MMQVILNADDFGKSPERNQAIDDSFNQGLISSAGLIITAGYLEDALNKAINGGYINRIHLHVNLSIGGSIQNPVYVPLTNAMKKNPYAGKNGHLVWYKNESFKSFGFFSTFNWKQAYREIEAQYNKFIEITKGMGNYKHIDFHLWYNLTWPVSVALFFFTRKYKIQSVRYIGQHQIKSIRNRLFKVLSWDPSVKSIPSTNVDGFLSNIQMFNDYQIIELYCHPNYKNGILLDDSDSYLHHEKKPMQMNFQILKEKGNIEFVSWEDIG
jgi:predicted glycoside hydrolase/deacetylase ChbG (UPF0249 family)